MFLFLILLLLSTLSSSRAACSTSLVFNGNNKSYATCSALNSWAHLSWTYDPSAGALDTMFRAVLTSSTGWAGWGINVGGAPAMVGSSVLLGFTDSSTNSVQVRQYKLTSSILSGTLPTPGSSDLRLVGSSLVDITGNVVTIFAKISLTTNSSTALNLVLNRGPGTRNLSPLPHQTDASFLRQTTAVIDLSSNRRLQTKAPHQKLKNQHGVLNTVGWGIFIPLGIMVARYLRPYKDPEWFYIHIGFQTLGYLLGVIGWGLGLKLASYSGSSSAADAHRNLGTSIFIFATLQVVALVFRPEPDHKIRFYWNIYHHGFGYLTLLLIFINIYKGFKLLQPSAGLQNLYTAFLVLTVLGSASLEAYSWYVYAEQKKKSKRPTAYIVESPISDGKV